MDGETLMERLRKSWGLASAQLESATSLSPKTVQAILYGIIVLIALFRLATISVPSLEWTSWKEIDYLMISRNFWQNGFNPLQPEVTWPAEPPRVTEMELPLVPYTSALLYQLFGYSALTARAVTLFAWLLMIVYVFKIARREFNPFIGLLSALAAGVLPLYHPFSRLLFTEPTMIAMSVVSIYYMAEWADNPNRRNWILAILSLSLTFSLKLETLYLLLPLTWIVFRKHRFNLGQYWKFALLIAASLVLPVIWYAYAYYLETIGAHLFGIFKGHNKSQFTTLLLDLRWYRTMAGRVINGITGGFYGFGLFGLGFLYLLFNRKGSLVFAYFLAVAAYFGLIAEGQIDSPYRQMPIIPVMSIFVAFGAQTLTIALLAAYDQLKGLTSTSRTLSRLTLTASFLLVLLIPFQRLDKVLMADSPGHPDRWKLAQQIKQTADPNSKLVVVGEYSKHVGGYDLSPVLFYYSDLQGWSLTSDQWSAERVEELRAKGATHLVFVLPYGYPYDFIYLPEKPVEPFIEEMRAKYPVLYEYNDQLVLDLR
jgi:4-amino-4-deoxy-L-arabinose transferase-like glycosyltransferase